MNSYHQLYSSNQLLYLIVSVEFSVHCNAKGVAVVGGKRIVRGKCISNFLLGINPKCYIFLWYFMFLLSIYVIYRPWGPKITGRWGGQKHFYRRACYNYTYLHLYGISRRCMFLLLCSSQTQHVMPMCSNFQERKKTNIRRSLIQAFEPSTENGSESKTSVSEIFE